MSSTRRAAAGSPPRQERFASSPEFNKGLMANLVARRCSVIKSREDRQLIWFLQFLSHPMPAWAEEFSTPWTGSLGATADELLKRYPERNVTAAMQKIGMKPGQVYSAQQVRQARSEIPDGDETFPLRGELTPTEILTGDDTAETKAHTRPTSYPVAAFLKKCKTASADLAGYLERLCLDPSISPQAGPWYFPNLYETLCDFYSAWAETVQSRFLLTEVGKRVFDELDYALETRTACLINGRPGAGKSEAAKARCLLRPGQFRYVEVPSSNDGIAFYRNIAKSLGVSINQNSKAQELRQRIEDTLQSGDLLICFDESHYLWPNLIDPRTLPMRINWLMTALINSRVPLVLVTTPQFHANQKAVEDKTRWTSEQFMRRIEHCQPIPEVVPESDFFALARFFLPEGDEKTIEIIVRYAQLSPKYLSAIKPLIRRARFLARQDGRDKACRADVVNAIRKYETPSDNALAGATRPESKAIRRRTVMPPVFHDAINERGMVPA